MFLWKLTTNTNGEKYLIYIMPFFGSKFLPKKAPLRKKSINISREAIQELVLDHRTTRLKLGEQQFVFEKGEWIPETGKNNINYKSIQKLKKKVQEQEEENNMLKLKYEMMLNMLTQVAADNQIQLMKTPEIQE